jgi:hypothetical protein
MIKRYTFLKHPFYFILKNSGQMVAGLEKCVGVFYNNSSKAVEVLSFNNSLEALNVVDPEFIDKLRISKKKINWIKKDQVPFEIGIPSSEQLSFTDEEDSNVLELHFLNPNDGKYDVLYLYFKSNVGNFKLSSANDALALDAKEIIQSLLYNEMLVHINTITDNQKIHKNIEETLSSNHFQAKISLLEQDSFNQAKDNYSYILDRLTEGESLEFGLSNDAVRRLSSLKLALGEVEQVLLASLEVIVNKHNPSSFYELSTHDLIINKGTTQPKVTVMQESLNATQTYLDRYEKAAKILLSKNEKITGLKIGEHCYPKVSPAAISDILKKHQSKIVLLMSKHPDKWSIIKNKFKPVANIYERKVVSSVAFGA